MRSLKRLSRPFEDEEETVLETPESGSSEEPDYAFEGYSVEFLEKVALMPVTRATATRSVQT